MQVFYTTSTSSHLFKSYALKDSLLQFGFELKIFLVDSSLESDETKASIEKDVISVSVIHSEWIDKITKKYRHQSDALRWGLKPAIGLYLLENGYDEIIYLDNDIYFYNSPAFLLKKLQQSDFLLTPHFYKDSPEKEQNWLEANYRIGLYNAGFVGANKNAKSILEWWVGCCLYEIKISYWRGLYYDQKYLDLVPILFDNVEIIKHRGCNFAGWNCDEVTLDKKDHQLTINGYDLIFIHFTPLSVERFSKSESTVYDAFEKYLETLQKHKPGFKFPAKKYSLSSFSTYFYYLRWKFIRLFE